MTRALALLVALGTTTLAFGQEQTVEVPAEDPGDGYTPDEAQAEEPLRFTGYLDVGFARATGNGSSFSPFDTRAPLDYGNDAFAPAVNSRGEVASTDTNGRFTNGFLPRSVGIGGTPSFLLNTASADVRFQPRGIPVFLFARLQLMPRFSSSGDATRVELQQAFGRVSPFKNHELALFVGRFDSVFGIEYLENEANLRTNITPSLIARYTTGQGLGAKAFYRLQLPALWSAVSLNLAVTNNGTRIEALAPIDANLSGALVGSGRLGYELNLQHVQLKAGLSGLYGGRNDQRAANVTQWAVGADLRLNVAGFSLAGEFLTLTDAEGAGARKLVGQSGPRELVTAFNVMGGWGRLAYTLPWKWSVVTGVTLYGRYDRRSGWFNGFPRLVTDRFTAGARVDLFELLAIKAEYLVNREESGAPNVDNDVFTSSAVLTW